jgi:hypothetical protein
MGKNAVEHHDIARGFVAGPNQHAEHPLELGGMEVHEWLLPLKAFRRCGPAGRSKLTRRNVTRFAGIRKFAVVSRICKPRPMNGRPGLRERKKLATREALPGRPAPGRREGLGAGPGRGHRRRSGRVAPDVQQLLRQQGRGVPCDRLRPRRADAGRARRPAGGRAAVAGGDQRGGQWLCRRRGRPASGAADQAHAGPGRRTAQGHHGDRAGPGRRDRPGGSAPTSSTTPTRGWWPPPRSAPPG